jgi:malate dehydrogenase (oxaloacetate-decarboxylating)
MVKDDLGSRAIELHRKARGKLEVHSKVDCSNSEGLSLAYTPGVAAVSTAVAKDPSLAYELTMKWNSVAVVSDGSRVLGLGNIGPLGAMPVMEGKAALFKSYANVDAFPICLSCKTADEIVAAVLAISPTFGGINLEDIESPKCFEVEDRLKELLDIPVFHDDQHGTGVVALSGLLNALEVVGKKKESAKVVVGGAGAAGFGITKMLLEDGFSNILVCDRKGIIVDEEGTADKKRELAAMTNKSGQNGSLQDALKGADAFIGVSGPNSLQKEWVKSMASDPIIFTLSNPVPEIDPIAAGEAGAKVVGTARSDYPNQVNNVLGFPGIFRGALMVQSREINEEMKVAAAHALAGLVSKEELRSNNVLPLPFDRRVAPAVALAVANAAMESGSARVNLTDSQLRDELSYLGLG